MFKLPVEVKALGFLLFLLLFTLAAAGDEDKNIRSDGIIQQIENLAPKVSHVVTRTLKEAVAAVMIGDYLAVLDIQGSLHLLLLDNENLSDLKWQLSLTTKRYTRASLLYQDNYIFCTIENVVYKIDLRKGEIIWNKELKAPVKGKVAILNDLLIALTIDNYLYAINTKDSSLAWSYQGSQMELIKLNSSFPVATEDNIVVVPFSSGDVIAFSEYGEKLWGRKLPLAEFSDHPFTAITIAPRVHREKVAVTNGSKIFTLNLNSGNEIWSKKLDVKAMSEATKNSIFIITNDNKVTALNLQDGRSMWTLDLANRIKINNNTYFSEPVFTQNKLFIATNQGLLVKLNPSNGTIEKISSIPKEICNTLVFSNSSFYTTTSSNSLFKM